MSVHTESQPRAPRLGVTRPADARVLWAGAAAAVLTDIAVRSGVAGVAGAALVVVVAAALVTSRRLVDRQSVALVAASTLFGAWLAIRMSPWLLPLDILAAGGLLVLGVSLSGGGSVLDLPFPTAVTRAAYAMAHGLAAPAFVAAPVRHRRGAAALRGVALAIPLLVVLGLLLGSADPVFADFFGWWSPEAVLTHGVLLAVGAWGMVGLLRVASAEPVPPTPHVLVRVGSVEAAVVVGSLVALFGAFAVAQLVALSSGGRHVIQTAGLTYAEYARSGFFQLLAVAAITLIALLGLRAVADLPAAADRRRFTILAEAAVGLTLVIVVVALRRLGLYEQAFGLTMLRLYSSVFAVWVGLVVVLAGCALAGLGARRAWLPAAAGAAGLVALFGLNVVNPEAVVARHNLNRAVQVERVDPEYLSQLSDDAVPALVAALPRLPEPIRTQVLDTVCAGSEPPFDGLWALNASRQQAADARRRACGGSLNATGRRQ